MRVNRPKSSHYITSLARFSRSVRPSIPLLKMAKCALSDISMQLELIESKHLY